MAHVEAVSAASLLAKFMELEDWSHIDDVGLADRIRDGLPTSVVGTVVGKIDPERRFLKEQDIVARSTFYRRKGGLLSKDDSEAVWALALVATEVLRIYKGDSERAASFMLRPHPLLKGRRPIDLTRESVAGANVVVQLLERADAGVAV